MFTRKIAAVTFYLILIGVIYVIKDNVLPWLDNLAPGSWPIILLLSSVLAMVPVIPFALVSGFLGIKYGLWGGGALSVTASTLAAVLTYFILAAGGKTHFSPNNRSKLHVWNEHIKHHTFLFVLIGRMLPFIPAALINGYAGWFKLPFVSFVTATALGKIPTMLVFVYIGISAVSGSQYWLPVLLIYTVFLSVVYLIYVRLFPNIKSVRRLENKQ
ncbi:MULTISPECIES: VTT domain-containing protein [unclassified Paenibacillus]|uniref:TVP38/TMEM64 family protein n=1 Tax=unclassified Paenibacillus TaxID=185978 RepID=UPI002404B9C1|nr:MULTISPECIES: VTT domain-containing protein [unclassified Paenibacillus]MDF9842290.1 putative membrane protein YdjX (TVP38/TMEM64 family) [Paenibacillus sp. PastF-2]MDF9848833.1 putative membrane protein YdjX (TVP38/TMEM64 family) [Paenibacillus sp. PastM-2]MDF9855403.1 putative membrane protein YdjX (TVP38/TMEM64 family) [Paenibacillus sp. PastF-1]MDH6480721.1 putative membrane protein YdjX (TVP38/TMEM64 family) [Paenibacillus sp. PastH-2]MDH6508098.1 putative membrane protein YdjX (TVP38/